jgi:hypothetical protein
MLNAYLHFEALSDHSYGFSCLMCGHFPPLLTLDVDKKGVFELAGKRYRPRLRKELQHIYCRSFKVSTSQVSLSDLTLHYTVIVDRGINLCVYVMAVLRCN